MRRFNLIRKDNLVLSIAILIFLTPVLGFEWYVLQHTNGVYTLPRDDSFLDLTIAKNLAFFGIWGLSKYQFAPVSSSLLFPITLAIPFFLFGSHVIIVFIVNTMIGIICLRLIHRWLIRQAISSIVRAFVLIAVIVFTPMPLIVVSGTEDILTLLCCFLWVTRLHADWGKNHSSWQLYLYTALMVATQYHTIILVSGACLLLLATRIRLPAILLALFAILPIFLFGMISVAKGGQMIPTRLWMATEIPYFRFGWAPGVLIAVGIPLLIRHESGFHRIRKSFLAWPGATLTLLAFSVLAILDANAFQDAGRRCTQVYEQSWLTGKFALRYYKRYGLAARDMGVISYLTEGQKLDLSGMDSKISPDSAYHQGEDKSVRVAILDSSHISDLSGSWDKVADWELSDNKSGKKGKIFFYTLETYESRILRKNLQDYQYYLPKKVAVKYY